MSVYYWLKNGLAVWRRRAIRHAKMFVIEKALLRQRIRADSIDYAIYGGGVNGYESGHWSRGRLKIIICLFIGDHRCRASRLIGLLVDKSAIVSGMARDCYGCLARHKP